MYYGKEKAMFVKLKCPQNGHFGKNEILTLTDDLDLSKGLTRRNTPVKYKRSVTYHSKVVTNVKAFCTQTNR